MVVSNEAARQGRPEPKLSIFIPTYNRAHLLRRCLASVRQTTVDCEILVGDDCSSDDTPALLAELTSVDSRVHYFRRERNVGPDANIYSLFHACRGEYVNYLGDDDFVSPGNFEKKVAILDAYPEIAFVYSRWNIANDEGQVWPAPASTNFSYVGGREEFWDCFLRFHGNTPSMVVRRSLWRQFGGYPPGPEPVPGVPFETASDWEAWLLSTYKLQTAFINEPLVTCGVGAGTQGNQVSTRVGWYAKAKLAAWRKWLVEADEPLIVEDRIWQLMRNQFLDELPRFAADVENHPRYLLQFQQLREDYLARVTAHAAAKTRFLVVSPAPQLVMNRKQSPRSQKPALIWSGPVSAPGAFAADLRALAPVLEELDATVRLEDVHWQDRRMDLPDDMARVISQLAWQPLAEGQSYVQVWHTPPTYIQAAGRAGAVVTRTMFGTDALPTGWADLCNEADLVWVPGQWNAESFARAGVAAQKLRILPRCVDADRYDNDATTPAELKTGRSFNFLSILDEWSLPSGWDILVQAFAQAFHSDDDVALVLLVRPGGADVNAIGAQIQQMLAQHLGTSSRVAPILVNMTDIADAARANILRAAQAYVQPHRIELWGRELLEAMAAGLPVIATNWGESRFLLDGDLGYLLECDIAPVPDGQFGLLDVSGHCWAEPSREHLTFLLRSLVRDGVDARAKRAQSMRRRVRERHGRDMVKKRLSELYEETAELAATRT